MNKSWLGIVFISVIFSIFEARAEESCVGCDKQTVVAPQSEYMANFCLKIEQINANFVVPMIKEMERTPYSVESYFQSSTCQPAGYSDAVKSPMIHAIADDPQGKQNFLRQIFLYYEKGVKKPELFSGHLNVKNTKGETFLDYIESLKRRNLLSADYIQEPLEKIINFACAHGAIYSFHKDKSCP